MSTAPIDLIEKALSISGGKPVEVSAFGKTIKIRRNFTGAEAHEVMMARTPGDKQMTIREQVEGVVSGLSVSSEEDNKAFIDELMELTLQEITAVILHMDMTAGLRDKDGNFFPSPGDAF